MARQESVRNDHRQPLQKGKGVLDVLQSLLMYTFLVSLLYNVIEQDYFRRRALVAMISKFVICKARSICWNNRILVFPKLQP